jgi:IS5 family transposase
LMEKISQVWRHIHRTLFPFLDEAIGPLSEQETKLASVLELVQVEAILPVRWWWGRGRPEADRCALAKAFVAKKVYNLSSTTELIERLVAEPPLRRLCGWEHKWEVPSESTFSRAFEEFAQMGLAERAHEALIREYEGERLVGHLSRDATDIPAREKAAAKAADPAPKPGKRGRPKKGEERPAREPSRLEKQPGMTLDQMLCDLPVECDWGTKGKSGRKHYWRGYKLHVDWADGEVPVSAILTSASVHDSQAAIPLSVMSGGRVENLYDLMDAGYDAEAIRAYSRSLGHIPIIDVRPRGGEKAEWEPAVKRRYAERTTAERGFSMLKESFGCRAVRVRGGMKVKSELMFGLLALAAVRLLNLLM